MAGYVHITSNIGLSMSSVSFNAIIEFSRRYFDSNSKEYESKIYESIDEGEMDFVSLIEVDVDGFMAFYKALSLAYEESDKLGKCGNLDKQFYEMVMKTWRELLFLLKKESKVYFNMSSVAFTEKEK